TDPTWTTKDPYLHAEQLRGTTLYISTGNGTPGPYDTLDSAGIDGDLGKLLDRFGVGGGVEAVTNICVESLRRRFDELGIPATFDMRPVGTHSWQYWQDDLHNSWPIFEQALTR
ncbi:esterase family protein, partial [Nocardia sp. NPDC127579]